MKFEPNKEFAINLGITNENIEPSLYQVIVHNDDYTPKEFVVQILEMFFYMDRQKATDVMLDAHVNGKASCGVFSRDFAEVKISQIVSYARSYEHPLNCSMEAA